MQNWFLLGNLEGGYWRVVQNWTSFLDLLQLSWDISFYHAPVTHIDHMFASCGFLVGCLCHWFGWIALSTSTTRHRTTWCEPREGPKFLGKFPALKSLMVEVLYLLPAR